MCGLEGQRAHIRRARSVARANAERQLKERWNYVKCETWKISIRAHLTCIVENSITKSTYTGNSYTSLHMHTGLQ